MLDTLLHDLDTLGVRNSIEFNVTELADTKPYSRFDDMELFSKEKEYAFLLNNNRRLTSKVSEISGKMGIMIAFDMEAYDNSNVINPPKYKLNLSYSARIWMSFDNGMSFIFNFSDEGVIITVRYKSKNPRYPESNNYMGNTKLSYTGESDLNKLILEKKTFSEFVLNQIEVLYPKAYKIIKHGDDDKTT